jgi:hypothetical protein
VFIAQEAVATSKDLLLDVFVYYEYRGHHGKTHNPLSQQNFGSTRGQMGERCIRLMIDSTRTAASIRDEVLTRKDIVPRPYQYLGCQMTSQTGFELGEKDIVAQVARRGEHVRIIM